MSIHPSLSAAAQNKKLRSVLKRTERLRLMMEKGSWQKGQSVFGLPKIKTVRLKIKKEKAKELPAEGTVATPTGTTSETPAQASPKTALKQQKTATPPSK